MLSFIILLLLSYHDIANEKYNSMNVKCVCSLILDKYEK